MSIHKITPFLSDIKEFFKNSDMTAAMQSISSVLTQVKMTERDTLAVTSKRNCVYRLLTVFQCLLLFPCFSIKNAYRNQKYGTLDPLIKARKDVFYRFMENPDVDWRKALWHISVQLWNRIHLHSDHKADEVCLILDDTDHEKTGRSIEKIGRVHSHLAHKAVLGFKCLCMAATDGISQILLDFAIVGEKGKKGNYGMSAKELNRRHTTKHDSEILRQREKEYDMSKIELAKEMIRRAVRRGIKLTCHRPRRRHSHHILQPAGHPRRLAPQRLRRHHGQRQQINPHNDSLKSDIRDSSIHKQSASASRADALFKLLKLSKFLFLLSLRARNPPYRHRIPGIPSRREYLRTQFREPRRCRGHLLQDHRSSRKPCICTFSYRFLLRLF